ncbi:DJ-1/PfpI/YhbO family deglycase/protease [Streptomyces alfalfae]|uniref:Protease n=1 Tax=Streptomyces alfalfae TaxID=1642299 RepID=A0A1P8TQA1_9ACTN|nr:DJ-1/PfpI/YhbO family deglycase/protease [Streptomyces alfalfae]AYA20236.1 DJ-1/PfpI/YhbO family deglycase/protease [Streptomyces fradiae]APY89783.1 protease [Streptomyces alfalfae]QQC87729.1 DJ-1/PfpI/YhbO family deglycase/protease [Streptomyces alfalfae]QUI30161.1 DJ-1/PfpI/YhbO family deglycase/protease [Streptomyces alfalfae]RXX43726.1 DJ-1/PfpI/YhbO family deglycase/protease [Streptomyces alfalfae]
MAENTLNGRRVLAVVSNYGIEQDELVVPVQHLRDRGAHVDVAAVSAEEIQTLVGDKDPGKTVRPDLKIADADVSSYDLLVVPGGTINADNLRLDGDAVEAVRTFARSGKKVAAICHGPWLLVEAGVLEGKTLTSYASVATDIRNAKGAWVDKAVMHCGAEGWDLITSRTPDDLDDFCGEIDATLAAAG